MMVSLFCCFHYRDLWRKNTNSSLRFSFSDIFNVDQNQTSCVYHTKPFFGTQSDNRSDHCTFCHDEVFAREEARGTCLNTYWCPPCIVYARRNLLIGRRGSSSPRGVVVYLCVCIVMAEYVNYPLRARYFRVGVLVVGPKRFALCRSMAFSVSLLRGAMFAVYLVD
jgi:hypothetical protein